jgi:hypothetical protein
MSKLPDPYKRLSTELVKMKEQLRRLQNRSPFFNTGLETIDPGQMLQSGSITIPDNGLLLVDGGDVVMLNEDLVEVFRVGVMEHGDRGVIFRRADGTEAMSIRSLIAGGPQVMRMYDRQGGVITGGALLSNAGFDVPYQDLPFHPVDYTSGALAQSTSSTTFAATHEHRGYRQNPAFKPQFMVKCSDGTTSAEVQVYDVNGSVYLGGFLGSPATHTITVPAGTTTFTLFEFSSALLLPGSATGQNLHLQIHVRRTAGAGSVSVAPVRTVGGGF